MTESNPNAQDAVPSADEDFLVLDGIDILNQISPRLRGEASMMPRPADVRVLLKTADLQGQAYKFPNHGHPDNEVSEVAFEGTNAVMIMPAGETARKQLFSAQQIITHFKSACQQGVTPDFIENFIVNPQGLSRRFAGQVYGPAPFDDQTRRFVTSAIPAVDGYGEDLIAKEVTDTYAVGMRAPVKEEAFLVIYSGNIPGASVKTGRIAAGILATLEDSIPASLKGKNTALEQLEGMGRLQKGIVMSVDAATGIPKPMRLGTAAGIFNLARMNVVYVNEKGKVQGQYLNCTP